MAEFLGDSLLVPVYFYFLGYGIAWAIAFVLARLLMKQGTIEHARNTRMATCDSSTHSQRNSTNHLDRFPCNSTSC